MYSYLVLLIIEFLFFWLVVFVDDLMWIIKSRFIDFFVFLFFRNKLICILLVYIYVLLY